MLFKTPINLNLDNAEVVYYPNFFNENEAQNYFESLLHKIKWQQDDITVFGKTYPQPRLTAFFSNNIETYKYSNIIMHPIPFNAELEAIKKKD